MRRLPEPAMEAGVLQVGLPRLEPVPVQPRRQLQRRHRRLGVPAVRLLAAAAAGTGPNVPPRERPRVGRHLGRLALPPRGRVLYLFNSHTRKFRTSGAGINLEHGRIG